MKTLKDLRTTLSEPLVEHPDVAHSLSYSPGWIPPNILILKRKTIRSYSSTERVALYYNDKLGRYFSVPYSVGQPDRDDVVGVSEGTKKGEFYADKHDGVYHVFHSETGKSHASYATKDEAQHKASELNKSLTKEEVIQEDAISHLRKVKEFATDKPLYHKDGSQTKVDPTTAHALLTVHGSLHPDNQKKFADALEHSKPKFHKMLDFAWAQVK